MCAIAKLIQYYSQILIVPLWCFANPVLWDLFCLCIWINRILSHMGKRTPKVEMCYTCFTLSQDVPEYVHTNREPACMYKKQLISVYSQAT